MLSVNTFKTLDNNNSYQALLRESVSRSVLKNCRADLDVLLFTYMTGKITLSEFNESLETVFTDEWKTIDCFEFRTKLKELSDRRSLEANPELDPWEHG